MDSALKRDNGKARLPGVPSAPVGRSWDALLRGYQLILKHRGIPASMDELMVYSGDAFNLCHGSHWQGVAYLCVPTDPVANLAAAYGLEYTCLHSGYPFEQLGACSVAERRDVTGEVLRKIRSEIDDGRTVLVGGCADGSCGDWTVVTGYSADPPELCHIGLGEPHRWIGVRGFPNHPDYDEDRGGDVDGYWNGRFRGTIRPNFVGGWQNNPAYLIGPQTEPPADVDLCAKTLGLAVALSRAESHHVDWWGGVDYHFGASAYGEWQRELRELDFPAELELALPEGAYDWYEMGNMDTQVDQIVRGRAAAAAFCERTAALLPAAGDELLAAAGHYRREAALARAVFEPFIPAYDGDDEPRVAWLASVAKREGGADAIGALLAEELAAVAALGDALEAIR